MEQIVELFTCQKDFGTLMLLTYIVTYLCVYFSIICIGRCDNYPLEDWRFNDFMAVAIISFNGPFAVFILLGVIYHRAEWSVSNPFTRERRNRFWEWLMKENV